VPATGFSIGVSRLLSALQIVKSPIVTGEDQLGPVVVLVMDRERIADYQRMVADLRNAKIRAELYLGSAGMKAQMKYADRRRAPCVVIQGSNEKAAGEVQIKDLFEALSAPERMRRVHRTLNIAPHDSPRSPFPRETLWRPFEKSSRHGTIKSLAS
jgi:histidyl-tRNA synthetase